MATDDNGAAAARQLVSLLENLINRVDEYYRWCDASYAGKYNDIGIEVRKRLVQVVYAVRRVAQLCEESANAQRFFAPDPVEMEKDPAAEVARNQAKTTSREGYALYRRLLEFTPEIELYTEMSYWAAFRARQVIRLLPKLQGFDSRGIREVRNKLIDHAENNDSQVMIGSFGFGGDSGPVLRALRYEHQQDLWIDAGLFKNLADFQIELERKITLAINSPPEGISRTPT